MKFNARSWQLKVGNIDRTDKPRTLQSSGNGNFLSLERLIERKNQQDVVSCVKLVHGYFQISGVVKVISH